ncbi:MAG: porin family protein [Lutimonas sp.]
MKKSDILLVLFIAFFSTTNYAQSNKYGIRLGVGLPHIKSSDNNIYSKDYETVAGFDGGLFADFGITERFSIKAELAFARKGGERNGMQPILSALLPTELSALLPPGTTIWADFDNKAVFSYIEIPILAKYEWSLGNTWGIYVNGGPYIDFIINPKQVTKGQSTIYLDEAGNMPVMIPIPPTYEEYVPAQGDFTATTDIDKDLATMDFGAMLGIGITANISENSELLFDVRGSYGFIPLQNDIDLYGSVHMGSISFSLGYAYNIDKKTKSAPKD